MATCTIGLGYQGVDFSLRGSCRAIERVRPVLSFLASHFRVELDIDLDSEVTVHFRPIEEFDLDRFYRPPSQRVVIRKGGPAALNLWGNLATSTTHEVLHSPETGTAVVFDERASRLIIYVSVRSTFQITELLRDLFLKCLEARQRVVLHAAAAEYRNKAILIVGAKGAGKSTLLLNLIGQRGLKMISGDKVILDTLDGGVFAQGWPDMPHLGAGTISQHPRLLALAREHGIVVDGALARSKFLLPNKIFEQALAVNYSAARLPVAAVIVPNVALRRNPRLTILDTEPSHIVRSNVLLSCNNPYCNWYRFMPSITAERLEPAVQALCRVFRSVPVLECFGPERLNDQEFDHLSEEISGRVAVI